MPAETLATTANPAANGAEPSESAGLPAKLLAAQQSVAAVVKRGVNKDQNYKYAMASDVIGVCRTALHDAGLFAGVHEILVTDRHDFQTAKGTKGLHVEVGLGLRVTDPDSGDSLDFPGMGAGADYGGGDKAILKASTAATKYAYANALALPFADHDPERDVEGVAGRLPKQEADPATALPDERVTEIATAYKASGFDFSRLSLAIGAVGGDSPKINRKDSIRKAVASLTPDQADKLHNVLDAAENGEVAS